jgi:hypothetical protein
VIEKLPIVDGSINDLIISAMAQIGGRATIEEITAEIHSYNGGKNVERAQVESALMALLFVGGRPVPKTVGSFAR